MNWFDLFVIILFIVAFVSGFISGFVMQIASLTGVILGAVFTGQISHIVAPKLLSLTGASPHIIAPLSYIVAFALIMAAILFAGKLIESAIDAVNMSTLNRLAGSIFAAAKWIIIFSILLNIIVEFDQQKKIIKEDVRTESYAYPLIIKVAQATIPYLRFDWFNQH